jgi:hypothetical protein
MDITLGKEMQYIEISPGKYTYITIRLLDDTYFMKVIQSVRRSSTITAGDNSLQLLALLYHPAISNNLRRGYVDIHILK